jgi:hypothetical protein
VALNISDLVPSDTPDYMVPAWLDCIRWASSEPDILEAFKRDTGLNWIPPSHPLDRAIDEATGATEHFLEAFIKWTNVNVWGPIDGPPEEFSE